MLPVRYSQSRRNRILRQIERRRDLDRASWADYGILGAAIASVMIVLFTGHEFYQTRQQLAQAQLDIAQAEGACLSALAGQAFDQWQREQRASQQLRGSL